MTEPTDSASQRELDDLRKRVAWIEQVAGRLFASSRMEVRNMLMPIITGSHLLEEELNRLLGDATDAAEAESARKLCSEVVSMIPASAKRLESRILEIMDFAEVAFAKPEVTLCRLNDVVTVPASKNIAVQVAGLAGLPTVEANDRQLRTLLSHLIDEAIARMPERSTLTVHGETDPQEQSILLRLTFPGIAKIDDLEWWDVAVHVMETYGGTATTELLPEGGTKATLSFPLEAVPQERRAGGSDKTKRLFAAVRVGDPVRIKKLIEQGASVNAHDESETPLRLAARNGPVEVVQLLLDAGADVNDKDPQYGWAPLHVLACFNDATSIAETLLRAGADMNAQDSQGITPLHHAVERGHVAIVKLLLDKGASVSLADRQGQTPLHFARYDGTLAELLVKAGAQVNAQDANGKTALHFVGNLSCADALLKAGADVNVQDNKGLTPLHWAVAICHSGLIKLLVESGANPNMADRQGETPLQLATHKGYTPDVEVMRTAGGA